MILGIQDPAITVAYLLAIFGALVCVGYGLANWNAGDAPVKPEDVKWAKEEKDEIEPAV